MKHTPKKGQMEVMGLAIVVILLALGMFFVIKFSSTSQTSSVTEDTQQRQIAISFVNTLLSANAGCIPKSATFTSVVKDMASPQYSILSCNAPSLKDYFVEKTAAILQSTFDQWNYKYELTVTFPATAKSEGVTDILIPPEGCGDVTKKTASPVFPIYAEGYGNILVQMKICS